MVNSFVVFPNLSLRNLPTAGAVNTSLLIAGVPREVVKNVLSKRSYTFSRSIPKHASCLVRTTPPQQVLVTLHTGPERTPDVVGLNPHMFPTWSIHHPGVISAHTTPKRSHHRGLNSSVNGTDILPLQP